MLLTGCRSCYSRCIGSHDRQLVAVVEERSCCRRCIGRHKRQFVAVFENRSSFSAARVALIHSLGAHRELVVVIDIVVVVIVVVVVVIVVNISDDVGDSCGGHHTEGQEPGHREDALLAKILDIFTLKKN